MEKKNNIIDVVVILGDPNKHDPIKWNGKFNKEDTETVDKLKEALNNLKDYCFSYLNNHDTLERNLKAKVSKNGIDFVFNLCDEGLYNEPQREKDIPIMLEGLGIDYTGADPSCMIDCYDKFLVKNIAEEMGIPVPKGFLVKPGTKEDEMKKFLPPFPAIIKPNSADGGFGITSKNIANNLDELVKAIEETRSKLGNIDIIAEEFLGGSDLSAGIIGNPPDYAILPIIEEDYSKLPEDLPKICGYEAKWNPDSPYWKLLKSKPADLNKETREIIEKGSRNLFERLECRDYARIDWRLDSNGRPKLLEVNPNPGWCWDGHLAKMSCFAGMSYEKMLEKILDSARKRFEKNKVK